MTTNSTRHQRLTSYRRLTHYRWLTRSVVGNISRPSAGYSPCRFLAACVFLRLVESGHRHWSCSKLPWWNKPHPVRRPSPVYLSRCRSCTTRFSRRNWLDNLVDLGIPVVRGWIALVCEFRLIWRRVTSTLRFAFVHKRWSAFSTSTIPAPVISRTISSAATSRSSHLPRWVQSVRRTWR